MLAARIRRIQDEAIDVKSFELELADGSELPTFTPGSHIDILLGENLTRQYSLCSGPEEQRAYRIAVKREPNSRGGSRAMHERVREGDLLQISVPRNNFLLRSADAHSVLIAGGIGITPLLSMVLHLEARTASYELHYFSRSISHTAFHALLSERRFVERVAFHYALEPEAVRAYVRRLLWHRRDGAHLYLCGPRAFMDLVEQTAASTWPPEAVHLEHFSADPASLAGARESFRVRLARSGVEYVIPSGKSVVQALAEEGIEIKTSCEQGVCGTCLTGVLEGTPDHRDVFLTDEERTACDKFLPCVSRARSEVIVLDL